MTEDIVAFYGCIIFFLVYCGLIIEGIINLPVDSGISFKRKIESSAYQLLFLASFLYAIHASWWDTFRSVDVFIVCMCIMALSSLKIMFITFKTLMKHPL